MDFSLGTSTTRRIVALALALLWLSMVPTVHSIIFGIPLSGNFTNTQPFFSDSFGTVGYRSSFGAGEKYVSAQYFPPNTTVVTKLRIYAYVGFVGVYPDYPTLHNATTVNVTLVWPKEEEKEPAAFSPDSVRWIRNALTVEFFLPFSSLFGVNVVDSITRWKSIKSILYFESTVSTDLAPTPFQVSVYWYTGRAQQSKFCHVNMSFAALDYDRCKSWLGAYCLGSLATIRTKEDHQGAVAYLGANSLARAWVGMRNWGFTNTSTTTDLFCQDAAENFTLQDCRSRGYSAVATSSNNCLQPYCGVLRINALKPRSVGRTAMRLQPNGVGGWLYDDQKVTSTESVCLGTSTQRMGDGRYVRKGPHLYWYRHQTDVIWNKTYKGITIGEDTPTPSLSVSVSDATGTSTLSGGTDSPSSSHELTSSDTVSESAASESASLSQTDESASASPSFQSVTTTQTSTISSSLTPNETVSVEISETNSKSVTDLSASLSLSPTLGIPSMVFAVPADRKISEWDISTGKWEKGSHELTFLVSAGFTWNCTRIFQNRSTIFQSDVSVADAEGGFEARIEVLMPREAFACDGTRLTVVFPKDRGLKMFETENITVHFTGAIALDGSDKTDVQHTEFTERFSLVHDRPRTKFTIPKAVVENVKTTTTTSSVVAAAAGNPAVAVQAARTALIMSLVQCEDTTEDGLDWMSHPTQLEVGLGITGAWAGAALWNPVIVMGTCFVHVLVCWTVASTKARPIKTGFRKLYFPALQAIVILPLLQPTAASIITIFRQSEQPLQIFSAVFSSCCILALLFYVGKITLGSGFRATFEPFPKEGKEKRNLLYVFLTGPGEYNDLDGGDTFVRMNFLFFDMYKPNRAWFGLIELGATVLFGFIEGYRPEDGDDAGCGTLVLVMAVAFVVFFLIVLAVRPYVAVFEMLAGLLIALIQAVGSVGAAVYAVTKTQPAVNVGGWTATCGLYVLSGKAVFDLLITFYDFVKDNCGSKKKEGDASGDGSPKKRSKEQRRRQRKEKSSEQELGLSLLGEKKGRLPEDDDENSGATTTLSSSTPRMLMKCRSARGPAKGPNKGSSYTIDLNDDDDIELEELDKLSSPMRGSDPLFSLRSLGRRGTASDDDGDGGLLPPPPPGPPPPRSETTTVLLPLSPTHPPRYPVSSPRNRKL